MSDEKGDPPSSPPPAPPGASDPPATDTATDWDEWMERHGHRPRPGPDVADAEGRFRDEK